MILIENLIDFGLREKEAKVYVATLELETATANEIAKKSGVNRSSTYVVIESLKKQGLVSMTEGKIVKQYVATPPETLLNLAKKRADKQERIKKMIENLVPSLEALHKDTKHKPKVFMYEGEDRVKAMYFEELSSLKPSTDFYRVYEDLEDTDQYLSGYVAKDSIERKKKKIKLRGINPDTKVGREMVERFNKSMKNLDENVLIPVDIFKFPKEPIDFAVYGNKVTFSSLRQSFSVVIEHQEIADTLKNIFDLAWKEAARLGKKY